MKTNNKFLVVGTIAVIVLSLIVIQTYIKRGVQGRLKQATDDIGDQFSTGNTNIVKTRHAGSKSNDTFRSGVSSSMLSRRESSSDVMNSYVLDQNFEYWGKDAKSESQIAEFRKLIKRASLNLEVTSARETFQRITELTDGLGGFLSDSTFQQYENATQTGHIVIKVNAKNFYKALYGIKGLGKVKVENITGEDVTEEYVDLTSRLTSAQQVRDRLAKILDERTGKLSDVLEVEREIGRVAEKIEQIQGRMKYLDNLTALATITVDFYEPFVPVKNKLDIVKKIQETFQHSWESCMGVLTSILIILVASLPVLFWLVLVGLIFWGAARLALRTRG